MTHRFERPRSKSINRACRPSNRMTAERVAELAAIAATHPSPSADRCLVNARAELILAEQSARLWAALEVGA